MNSRLTLLVTFSAFLMVGCSSLRQPPGATFDRIGKELQNASDSKSRGADAALQQAMLPSAQANLPEAQNIEPRFDLAINSAPANQVFMALVSGTRYSMVLTPEVGGSITVNLKNVTVREALETIREVYGYEFRIQGTRIYIQPNTLQARIFKVNYLLGKRDGKSDLRVTSTSITSSSSGSGGSSGGSGSSSSSSSTPSSSTDSGSPSATVTTTSDHDFWKELEGDLNIIVGHDQDKERTVKVNKGSGVILVKGYPSDIRAVENYLKATQLIIERQVMLEAKLIQVTLSEGFQAGINWAHFGGSNNRFGYGAVNQNSNLTMKDGTANTANGGALTVTPGTVVGSVVTGAQTFFGLAFQSGNFSALLNFLETQGTTQVLSSPRIATMNNQKAVLKVGVDEFFVTNVSSGSSSTTGAIGSTTVSAPNITLQPFFSGIAFDVTPQIDDEDNIVLHIHPAVSKVTEKQKIIDLGQLGKYTLPLASSNINETDSIVRVKDGNIVAIGGLMEQMQDSSNNGVPGTTSSAWGVLFGTRNNSTSKSEMVILIKPTIIRDDATWKGDLMDLQDRMQQLDPRSLKSSRQ